MDDARVVVAGGGLAGLVAARHLARAGADVRLFERRDGVGGRVRSRERDGFTLDRGFQVLFTGYPAARRELDLGELDLRYFTPGACIARPGRRSILSDPLRDPAAATHSLFNREVTTLDKLRVLKLRRELRGRSREEVFSGPDTTIREYLRDRGFSETFVERFAAPFYGGITLDRSLSSSARVFEYTFGVLAEGGIAVPAAGMGAIARQLRDRAEAAGATVATDSAVTDVRVDEDPTGDGGGTATVELGGETIAADAIVVATDPRTARELTGVEAIPTGAVGCVTQWYAYDDDKPLDTGKRLLLNAADADPNHVVPHSAVAPEYSPDDRALLSATYLADDDADEGEVRAESDAALAERTHRTLADWYPEHDFGDLEPIATDRIPFAQFAQPPGVHESLPEVRAPDGPVYLAGEYTQWSAIAGAMDSGRTAARAVDGDLG